MTSPWFLFAGAVLVVGCLDLVSLRAVARRTNTSVAAECAVAGLTALVAQAGGIFATLLVMDDLTSPGSGWLIWLFPALAVVMSAVLVSIRSYRRYGWAVLVGSVQGFIGFFALVLTAAAACNCWD